MVQPDSMFVTELPIHTCLLGAYPIVLPFTQISKVQFAYASSALLARAKDACLGCVVVVMQHVTGRFNADQNFIANGKTKFFAQRKRDVNVHFDIREGVDQSHGARVLGNS